MSIFTYRRSQHSMKRFYNWFQAYYGLIERSLNPSVQTVVDTVIVPLSGNGTKTACEYACGSGMLSLKIAPHFAHVTGKDASSGMLARARLRAEKSGVQNVSYSEGDILSIDSASDPCDWTFVSFALHLFSPEDEINILRNLYASAREGVVIIDHSKRWNPAAAFVEWIEGSHYDRFIKMNFSTVAEEIGAAYFSEREIKTCSVMIFSKNRID